MYLYGDKLFVNGFRRFRGKENHICGSVNCKSLILNIILKQYYNYKLLKRYVFKAFPKALTDEDCLTVNLW